MTFAAVILIKDDFSGVERCLKTLTGWVKEVVLVSKKGLELDKRILNKYTVKVIYSEGSRDFLVEKGIRAVKADWVLVLNSDEEVSIPLKIEMKTSLSKVKKDCVNVPVFTNKHDVWRKAKTGEKRIYRRYTWQKTSESESFHNPIREYLDYPYPLKPLLKKAEVKNILVIKLRGIGDTVLMTPLLKNLKAYYRSASITCMVKKASADVLQNNPFVDKVAACDGFFDAFSVLMHAGKFDLVLCPQASLRSALFGLFSGARVRSINNHNGRNYFGTVRVKKPEEYEDAAERDLDCLRALGVAVKTKDIKVFMDKQEKLDVKSYGFTVKDTIVGISPSASKVNKMWFKERFAELADKLISEKKYKVIFINDPAKPDALKQVMRLMKNRPYVVDNVSLRKVMQLMSSLDVFVGNDSGLSHIAAALGVPSVALIGPDEPKIFHPYSEKDKHFIVSSSVDCKPCWKESCDMPFCLDALGVAAVLNTIEKAVR